MKNSNSKYIIDQKNVFYTFKMLQKVRRKLFTSKYINCKMLEK